MDDSGIGRWLGHPLHSCFNEARPVGRFQKLRLAVLLHNLRYDDELVVNRLALLALLHAVGGDDKTPAEGPRG